LEFFKPVFFFYVGRHMNLASMSIPAGSAITAVLNPSFKGIPDAKALATYLLNALVQIKKENLPVKIYLTQDVSNKIGNLLTSMGIKIRTIPADKMEPPYIFIYAEGSDIVIKTVDTDGKEVNTFRAPFAKFVETFETLVTSKKERKVKQKEKPQVVDEVFVGTEDLHKFMEYVEKIIGKKEEE